MSRKLLLSLLGLLLMSDALAAHWQAYARNREGGRYYDPTRRISMSGSAIVWDLHDLPEGVSEQGKVVRSVLYPTEVNCRQHRMRVLSVLKMDGPMGGGALVHENTLVGDWREIMAGTPEERLMDLACVGD